MSANFWDFVGGASDYLLKQRVDTQQQAAAQKRELEKAKALEALRRETGDYEYARERGDKLKTVDDKQSYLDPESKQYVMVNSEGKEVGRRSATTSELAADSLTGLKIEDTKADIQYKRKLTANVGASSGGGGYSRRSLDSAESASDKNQGKLQAQAAAVIGNIRKYNLPEDMVLRAESEIRKAIVSGVATPEWLRRFESAFLGHKQVQSSVSASAKMRAAKEMESLFPKEE